MRGKLSTGLGFAITLLIMGQHRAAQAQSSASAPSRWGLNLEYDHFNVFQNTVQRPNNSEGTRFNVNNYADDSLDTARVTVTAPLDLFRAGDELRFEFVPFEQSGTETAGETINFNGTIFASGVPRKVFYKFNTYRLTYDLPIFRGARAEGWDFRIGGTIALRDAAVKLSQPHLASTFTNQGPVPLLYVSATKSFGPSWKAIAEFEGLAAPGGGGLFDASIKIAYAITRQIAITAGYRYEAGGATETSIYTFLDGSAGVLGLNFVF
jgi:hypothetical protein